MGSLLADMYKMMHEPGKFRDDDWGQIVNTVHIRSFDIYAGTNVDSMPEIWFKMSTWNPYQAMLMTSRIPQSWA